MAYNPDMTFDEIKKHFHTVSAASRELRVTRSALYDWRDGGVPEDQQRRIQSLTKGALKIDTKIANAYRRALAA
jgi:hypothetical protein